MTRGDDGRLVGWKAIGMFLGRDERTVRRWEVERGLPVNRVPGGGSATVWALPEELRAWMAGDAEHLQIRARPVPDAAPQRRSGAILLAACVIGIVVGAPIMWQSFGNAAVTTLRPEAYGNDAQANELYQKASFGLNRRSVPGLLGAATMFEALTKTHSHNAAGFVGLAEANLLLREFNSIPNEAAYRRAAAAAQAALALDPNSAAATRALAFVRYHGEGKRAEGLKLFERALALDPAQAQSYHWYATALICEGRAADAGRAFARARQLDPGSSAIAADAAYALYLNGQHGEAIAELQRIAEADSAFSGAYRYLARFYLIERRNADYLAAAAIDAKLRKDPDVVKAIAAATVAYKAGGRKAMLASLVAHETAQFEQNGESALRVAMYAAATGDSAQVIRWLEKAESINEPEIRTIMGYVEFVPYRDRIKVSPALKSLIS
jgi:tetratricopeptide (TPR) repeat protein